MSTGLWLCYSYKVKKETTMATRNDTFKNVKIGEKFYWGGNTCLKLSDRKAEVFMPLYDTTQDYFMCDNDFVTVG